MVGVAAVANVITALSLNTPLRYVAVGFLAIILSEVADTEVYQRLLKRRWLTRVAASNAVSIPIDTVGFTLLAFYGAAWATAAWMIEVHDYGYGCKVLGWFSGGCAHFRNRGMGQGSRLTKPCKDLTDKRFTLKVKTIC